MLPKAKLGEADVDLSVGTVHIRSLTLKQTQILGEFTDSMESTVAAIAWATDSDKAAAAEWVEESSAGDVTKLLEAILEVSGLTEGARFPVGQADDAGESGPAE